MVGHLPFVLLAQFWGRSEWGQCSTSHLCHTADSISVTLTSFWHWKIFRNPKTLWVPLYLPYSKKGSCHLRKDSQLDRGLYLPQCPSLNYHHSHSNNSAVPTIHHIHLLQVSVHPSPCCMYGVLINYVQKNFVYLHPKSVGGAMVFLAASFHFLHTLLEDIISCTRSQHKISSNTSSSGWSATATSLSPLLTATFIFFFGGMMRVSGGNYSERSGWKESLLSSCAQRAP